MESANVHLQRARISAERGEIENAISHFRLALNMDGALVEAWMQLANGLFMLGRIDEAKQALASGVTRNPDSSQIRFMLGSVYLHHNEPAAAVACLRRAVELEPRNDKGMTMLGIAYQMQGNNAAAAECFQKVVAINPADPDAPFYLGTVMQSMNQIDRAVAAYRQALSIRPDRPEILNNLGVALLSPASMDEAIACFERAAQIDPNNAQTFFNLGNALRTQGQFERAVQAYRRAATIDPRHAGAGINLGLMLRDLGRFDESMACYRNALAANPANPDLHSSLGAVLEKANRIGDAISCYRNALLHDARHVEALANLGAALIQVDQIDEAIACCRKAVLINPGYVEAHYGLGRALQACNDPQAAMASYRAALELEPGHANAWTNIGVLLQEQGEIEEAIACYRKALARNAASVDALINLAVAFQANRQFDEALASYNEALQKDPGCAEARYYRGLLRLLTGDFSGWEDCECRFTVKRPASPQRTFQAPRWHSGIDLRGKSILLHAEQGMGDTVQFARYAGQVAAAGATVYLEVQPALKALFRDFPGVAKVFAAEETLPSFDYYCPLLSLPFEFKTERHSIPAGGKYLQAPAGKTRLWAARMPAGPEPRVGVVWAGNPHHKNDRNRSIKLASLASLFDIPGLRFYSLQKDIPESDLPTLKGLSEVAEMASDFEDYCDTAAAIANLDLVISVDTSVAHLAGALGAPVWILIPFNTDFRWFVTGEDSPWYPSARLFRQPAFADWQSVIGQIRQQLGVFREEFASNPQPRPR